MLHQLPRIPAVKAPNKLDDWYKLNALTAAGIDEAGRGPLAGPVVAAAVVLDPNRPIAGLDDSKKLTEAKRELLFAEITQAARAFGLGTVSAAQIDEMNILRASLHAMKLALADLQSKVSWRVSGALVDGNQKAPLPPAIVQFTVVDGDALWPEIMAASILAKVVRDRMMVQYANEFPGYGFEQHKGYSTSFHLEALKRLGPSPIHRRSFAPVRECFETQLNFASMLGAGPIDATP